MEGELRPPWLQEVGPYKEVDVAGRRAAQDTVEHEGKGVKAIKEDIPTNRKGEDYEDNNANIYSSGNQDKSECSGEVRFSSFCLGRSGFPRALYI